MTTINKYQIYNLSTGLTEFGWAEQAPTVPFSNSSQQLDPSSVRIIDTIQRTVVSLREDYKGTNGYYHVEGYTVTVPGNTTTTLTYSQPYQTVVMDISFASDLSMQGDVLNIASDDIVVGAITANVTAGQTFVIVGDTVIANVVRGFRITISNGVNTDPLFKIIAIDTVNKILTLDRAFAFNFTANAASVAMRVSFAENYRIGPPMKHQMGSNISGGVSMPANHLSKASYTNNSSVTKTIYFNVQRLY
jgi:hypothetical protein